MKDKGTVYLAAAPSACAQGLDCRWVLRTLGFLHGWASNKLESRSCASAGRGRGI